MKEYANEPPSFGKLNSYMNMVVLDLEDLAGLSHHGKMEGYLNHSLATASTN